MKPAAKYACILLFALLVVGLRAIHLDSDPPSWLSWSSGIYTDEGIYASDARSVVLFGHWSAGDFHSAEIAPVHHLLLMAVFRLLGVSLTSARLVSVLASLGTLLFLYLTLKVQYNSRTAIYAVIFLALSPVALFYSRLALLETPTALLLTFALYLIVSKKPNWLTGIVLALAVCCKPLALFCVPAFFIDFRRFPAQVLQRFATFIAGLAAFFLTWQVPHHTDLGRLNKYYLWHQYLPHSTLQLEHNLFRSLWSGSSDGILPYLIHHEPLLLLALILALFSKPVKEDLTLRLYAVWLAVPALAFCSMSYEPSRYFILFWPTLAALAAVVISKSERRLQAPYIAVFLVWSLAISLPSIVHPTFSLRDAGVSLGRDLPQSTTIVGQYAPEFALSNSLHSVYVQPGLANTKTNIQSSVILITKSPYWDNYWTTRTSGALNPIPAVCFNLPHNQIISGWQYSNELPRASSEISF
jgi:4-amino-4-deoxy-L-arabinose transferase-like glycosyltransferase